MWPVILGERGVVQDFKMTSEVRQSHQYTRLFISGCPLKVATMQFLHKHTSVPVPKVLHHDKDEDGAVGGEWMLIEYVSLLAPKGV